MNKMYKRGTTLCQIGTGGRTFVMKHHYPSVTELLAFTLSAKHLSFSRAARELGQTPSAISRQVANLESFFNVQLFVRDAKHVALTHSGTLYLARIAKPLA